MAVETERRFLVEDGAIDLARFARVDIEQRYLPRTGEWSWRIEAADADGSPVFAMIRGDDRIEMALSPDNHDELLRQPGSTLLKWTCRTRRSTSPDGTVTRVFTMKRDRTSMSCDEIEMDLSERAYEDLGRHTGPTLLKTRWDVPHGDLVIEIDAYRNPELVGLVVAEVELPSEDAPFAPPAWLGREITGEKAYTNAALARSLEGRWMASTGMLPEWDAALAAVMGSPKVADLRSFLLSEYVARAEIMPPANRIFSALTRTAPGDVRVVILGQDPYPTPGNAHGLAFSVMPGVPVPASLANIYKEMDRDLGAKAPSHGHLAHWADQGVLLLNAVLTVRKGESDSHKGRGWEAVTDEIIRIVADDPEPKVFVLWGNKAQKKARLIDEDRHLVIRSPHPSPLSAHVGFFGSRPFSRANRFLEEHGRKPIAWEIPEIAVAAE